MKCADCGAETYVSYTSYGSIPLCDKCYDEREHMRLEEKAEKLKKHLIFINGGIEIYRNFSGCISGHISKRQTNIAFL